MCFKMPNMTIPQVTTTARDIVPERESKAPESALFGTDEVSKNKGIKSLQIKPMADSYNPLNN